MKDSASPSTSQSNHEVMLTILTGPESGVAYKLLGQTIRLGRASDNDVVLDDPKSSRYHAELVQKDGQYWIVDKGSANGVMINGQEVREALLRLGDQLIVGSTLLRFGAPQPLALVNAAPPVPPVSSGNAPSHRGPSSAAPFQSGPIAPLPGVGGLGPVGPSRSKKRSSRYDEEFGEGSKPGSILPLFLLLVVGVVGFILFYKSDGSKRELSIKDDEALEQEIDMITDTNEKREAEILKKGKDTQQYSEAQAFYLRGFREFREGNYSRAIQNFETALALFPNHPLAKRYLDRSRLKLNELITAGLERGEKEFQLERYNNAFNEYRTVILLSGDPKSKAFQLAQKRIEAINLILMNSK